MLSFQDMKHMMKYALPFKKGDFPKEQEGTVTRYFGSGREHCAYMKCNREIVYPRTTLQLFCCKEHRLLARGSKKGKRVAARIRRRAES